MCVCLCRFTLHHREISHREKWAKDKQGSSSSSSSRAHACVCVCVGVCSRVGGSNILPHQSRTMFHYSVDTARSTLLMQQQRCVCDSMCAPSYLMVHVCEGPYDSMGTYSTWCVCVCVCRVRFYIFYILFNLQGYECCLHKTHSSPLEAASTASQSS